MFASPSPPSTESRRVRGGQNLYGFTVGILMLDTQFPRIVGDMGNAATFDFPVRYHRVAGASPDLVVRRGDPSLVAAFVEGARVLEREGVGAISTNCGFLSKFQRELAAAVRIPVFTSSLMLVPLVHRMLAPGRAVGILTVDASALTPEHLAGAGITPAPTSSGPRGSPSSTSSRSSGWSTTPWSTGCRRCRHHDGKRRPSRFTEEAPWVKSNRSQSKP